MADLGEGSKKLTLGQGETGVGGSAREELSGPAVLGLPSTVPVAVTVSLQEEMRRRGGRGRMDAVHKAGDASQVIRASRHLL